VADWLGSLAQVAGVAGQLIASFMEDDEAEGSSAETGAVEWDYVQQTGKSPMILAKNTSGVPVGLTYTLSRENQNLSVHQPLDPGHSYSATDDVDQFLEGNVAIAPTVSSDGGEDDSTRTILFAIAALSIGAAVAVIKGVTFSYNRTATGFSVSLQTDAQPVSAAVTARDSTGNSVSAGLKIGAPTAGGAYVIDLPTGVDLDPVADHFDLELVMPTAVYVAATRERAALQIPLGAAV
jgi:hypothetical protein